VIFLVAVITRLLFPGVFAVVGERVTTAVDYRTALAILGEGISGEREFISAVGEAFTYAFRGASSEVSGEQADAELNAVDTFGAYDYVPGVAETDEIPQSDLAGAIFTAFRDSMEGFSYFNIPAGTTFDMPILGLAHTAPVEGAVVARFGAVNGGGRFNHGVDIASDEGAQVVAFADGEVIAVGQSAILGSFVIISHDGAETRYARLSETLVTTGQAVKMGETIAHADLDMRFELRIDGVAVNPEHYVTWD